MKVMLINPPRYKGFFVVREERCAGMSPTSLIPPLGLAYTTSYLKKKGHEVNLIDANGNDFDLDYIKKQIKSFSPDLIILKASPATMRPDLETARIAKKINPRIKTALDDSIVGATLSKEILKIFPYLDMIIRGEPELTSLNICNSLEKKKSLKQVRGIAFREHNKIFVTKEGERVQDLDELPFPAYDFLPMSKYFSVSFAKKSPWTIMMSSRGCPFSCIYCCHPQTEVITQQSHKNITQIKEGDLVLSLNGKFNTVEKAMSREYNGSMISITPYYLNHQTLKLTPNHKVFVKCENGIKEIRAGSLSEKDYLVVPVPNNIEDIHKLDISEYVPKEISWHKVSRKLDNVKIEKIKNLYKKGMSTRKIARILNVSSTAVWNYTSKKISEDRKYRIKLKVKDNSIIYSRGRKEIPRFINLNEDFLKLVGYYLAEGSVYFLKNRPNSSVVVFTFGKHEKKYINEVAYLAKNIFGLEPVLSETKTGTQVILSSSILGHLFKNLFGMESTTKHIPHQFLYIPQEKQIWLLYSLIKGDGSIKPFYKNKKSRGWIDYTTSSKILSDQVLTLFLRQKILPSCRKWISKRSFIQKREVTPKNYVYTLRLHGEGLRRFCKLLNLRYQRNIEYYPYKRAIFDGNHIFVKVKKISKSYYSGKVYNLMVSKDHCYVSHNMLIANCIVGGATVWRGYGKNPRFRSVKNVVDEMELLSTKYGIKDIEFWDENLTMNKKRLMDICNELIRRKLPLVWSCNSRADTVDKEMLKKMKEAGCWNLVYGVESGSQKILDFVNKRISTETIKKTFKITHEVGMNASASFMVGLPGETWETVEETLNFAKAIDPDFAQFGICTPYPGTTMEGVALKEGWIKGFELDKYDPLLECLGESTVMNMSTMSAEEVMKAQQYLVRKFYFRPKLVAKRIMNISSIKELEFLFRSINYLVKRSIS
jgi:radical SAM superfamily enzyme YgiQ (UPF0313 family)